MSEENEVTIEEELDIQELEAEAEESTGGSGIIKWVAIGLGSLVLIGALGTVAFLLITGRLTGDYTRLNAVNPTLFHPDGMSITAAPDADVRVKLSTVPREVFLADGAGKDWINAHAALPQGITPLSPIYVIEKRGEGSLQAEMNIPNGAEPLNLLDLYCWDEAIGQWVFVPGEVDRSQQVIVFSPPVETTNVIAARTEVQPIAAGVVVSAGGQDAGPTYGLALAEGISLDASGQISGAAAASSAGTILTMISNPQGSFSAYGDPAQRDAVIGQLLPLAATSNGLALDFAPGAGYTDFVSALAEQLHIQGKRLDVIVHGDSGLETYDLAGIGEVADFVWIAPASNPTGFSNSGPVEATLNYAVNNVHRYKLGLLVDALHLRITGEAVQAISFDEAIAAFGAPQAVEGYLSPDGLLAAGSSLPFQLSGKIDSLGYDDTLAMNYLAYYDDAGTLHYVYLASAESLSRRLSWAREYGLNAVAVNGISHPQAPQNIADGLNGFLSEQAVAAPGVLAITWQVQSAAGASLEETSGGMTFVQFLWEATAEPGAYLIKAMVGDQSINTDRGSVAVELIVPTTETPEPEEPTPTPAVTLTPRPTTEADATPAPTPAPVVGSVKAGVFELGGQTHTLAHPDQMRQAGMTWVKFQHKWGDGDTPQSVADRINAAHAAGFKVLLAIPGHSGNINYESYVEFLRGVATFGPDAIEVWNEMNLEREWPRDSMNGASYVTNMLAPAYEAIKSVNPNILVISGAPAPTGLFGARGCGDHAGEWVCGDLLILEQMRDAGAANYMDCVGAHYNEGIIAPSQTSGDPRDAYYTRYFQGMLDTYYGATGVPVCFTEIGYLTPEGYGGLPPNFAWAGETSVQEQATWLAEAAVLASQSDKVRLMIVWNVDIFDYGNDPQGGFAIIRPGGECPACVTLGGVMQ